MMPNTPHFWPEMETRWVGGFLRRLLCQGVLLALAFFFGAERFLGATLFVTFLFPRERAFPPVS
jgi:hypothetical protein